MKYNVTLINPAQYKFAYMLTDICRTIAAGIRELGHDCDLTVNNIDIGAMNIIVGTHLLTKPDIDGILGSGARYMVLHTEWLYPAEAPNLVRSSFQGDTFEPLNRPLFERAEAVWEAWDNNLQLLARWDIAPERFKRFWIGYSDALVDITHRAESAKDIDVLFYGVITPHRQPVLEELSKRVRLVVLPDAPNAFRNDYIARAKINLSIQSAPELNIFSFTRVGYLLNNCAFALSESAPDHRGMLDYVEHARRDRLVARVQQLLRGGQIPALARDAAEHYRSMPMRDIVREML